MVGPSGKKAEEEARHSTDVAMALALAIAGSFSLEALKALKDGTHK